MTEITPPLPENRFDASALGAYLRAKRIVARLSLRQLAERAGISPSYLSRLESGRVLQPSPAILYGLAEVLEIDSSDLFALTGYTLPTSLPSFTPYLRAKYNMSDDAVQQLSDHFQQMTDTHDITERPSSPPGRRRRAH